DGLAKDLMTHDGLTCSFTGVAMGEYGSQSADEMEISREEQDRWALRSHERAIKAQENGSWGEEIVPVSIPQRKGDPLVVSTDE
ncbi:acetyl-CoA C-acyltransferase, partial [Aeromonas dhakensis]